MQPEPWTDSRVPALAIVARGDQITEAKPGEYSVRSQSRQGANYTVTVTRNRWSCTCSFHAESGGLTCIHILAVKFRAGFQGSREVPETVLTCARCGSGDVTHYGRRANKSGVVRRLKCGTCGATFSGKEGFRNRRANPDMIAKALDLYFRGTSLRQVADHFAQAYNLPISAMTVYRWVTHYSELAAKWLDAQGAKVGEKWNVDETVVSVDGDKRWVWNVMDAETRFLLATHVSKNRSLANTRAPLQKARRATRTLPEEIRTDGMSAYPAAIKKEFGRYRRPGDDPANWKISAHAHYSPHKVVPSIRAPESNNLIERLNGSQRDRTRPMRGFDTMRGTAALMEGWRVHYDAVRTHLALGVTPAEAAGLPDLGTFKWRTILDLATNRSVTPVLEGEDQPST